MRTTTKQTPLGVNLQSGVLQNCGFRINPDAEAHMGISKINPEYEFGSVVRDTCLNLLTWSIHDGYNRNKLYYDIGNTYDKLIKIGEGICEALGNAKPPTYNRQDDSDTQIPIDTPTWYHENYPATTGYAIAGQGYASPGVWEPQLYPPTGPNILGQGQHANWIPYTMENPNNSITQWGFIRCWALQAWNEFNWNGGITDPPSVIPRTSTGNPLSDVQYKDFCHSWLVCSGFMDYNNISVDLLVNAPDYLKGVYSNMNDLTSSDMTGISLATSVFGQDCITAGKAVDLSKIDKFGLPSVLLQTIQKYHTMTQSLNLALISAGLVPEEILDIANEKLTPSKTQEQKIYGAFLVIKGQDLTDIMVPLNCKTQGLTSLADLLNVKKLFPNAYPTLTLPVYNTQPSPTNSKTYYPIYRGGSVNPAISSPQVAAKIGAQILAGTPPIADTTRIATSTPTTSATAQSSNIVATTRPAVTRNNRGIIRRNTR